MIRVGSLQRGVLEGEIMPAVVKLELTSADSVAHFMVGLTAPEAMVLSAQLREVALRVSAQNTAEDEQLRLQWTALDAEMDEELRKRRALDPRKPGADDA